MSEVWQEPQLVGNDWLLEVGGALLDWWQSAGPRLPESATEFMRWWDPVRQELQGNWAGPGITRGDAIAERLHHEGERAHRWWSSLPRSVRARLPVADGPPRVQRADSVADLLEPFEPSWPVAGVGAALVVIAVGVGIALYTSRR